jgi:hypothetical protein
MPIDIRAIEDIDIDNIIDSYKISSSMVEKKKSEIIMAFNKYL